MPQRPASYTGRRVAPARRSVPPRRAPSRPASRPARTGSAAAPAPGSRRRMAQLVVSAALLLAVVAMNFLFPATLERCRATLLDLLGADTDFVEVFAAAGRAFSDGSTVSDALNDAYTAVFGASEVPVAPAVERTAALPDNVDMLQHVLNLDYADPVSAGQITSLFGARSDPGKYVTVAHDGGYSTLYAHCARVTASDGQQVKRGDPIAEMGDTGRATGFHLHFELHQNNTYLNPIYYVTFS